MRLLVGFALLCAAAAPAHAQGYRFGGGVALGEGVVVVSEMANQQRPGRVYVYRKTGQTWRESAVLVAPEPTVRDGFGASIALNESTLFVGQANTIHIFRGRSDGSWEHADTLVVPELTIGRSIATSGDWLFVGAPSAPSRRPGSASHTRDAAPGSVHAYSRATDGGWVYHRRLRAQDPAGDDGFGASIAMHDRFAVIGASGRGDRPGAAYVYQLDPLQRDWRESGQLHPGEIVEGDDFGAAVAVGLDIALVGGSVGREEGGAAFVFRRDSRRDVWAVDTLLSVRGRGRDDSFGAALAIVGDQIWVGVPSSGLSTGSVYGFGGEGGQRMPSLSAASAMTSPDPQPGDRFGAVLALNDRIAAVAATGIDHGAGAVFLYQRDQDGTWRPNGVLKSEPDALDAVTGKSVECDVDGRVGPFECANVELLSFLPVHELTLPDRNRGSRVNDLWGWTDTLTGREYAIVGRIDGTSFVDVTDPVNPIFVGDLPQTPGGPPSPIWRDVKVYGDHAYIVADAAGAHGVQVFDLTKLRDVHAPPIAFEVTAHYDRIGSAHNIVINEESGFAYVVGATGAGETCGGGLHMIDIREPARPTFAGCFTDIHTGRTSAGYTHDAQCVIYRGPDQQHHNREICLGANETAISIADVTNKSNPVALSRASYPGVAYAHQGWLTEDQRYFVVNDELDEIQRTAEQTRTLIWDVSDLKDPQLAQEYFGSTSASDHNLYINGSLLYQSNYRAGLRIIDMSEPLAPREIGFLDTTPYLPAAPGLSGAWSNYPFFRSGAIAVTSTSEGLFLVRHASRN